MHSNFVQKARPCVDNVSVQAIQFKGIRFSLQCMFCWQVYHDSEEGQRYIQFYKLNKFPYISILDPRTGKSPCIKCFLENSIQLLHAFC